jgi:superfamily II DNA or RNA helicase
VVYNVADSSPLKIQVDTDVQVSSEETPRKVVEAIRRQLRQHDLHVAGDSEDRRLLNLLQTRGGCHRMPQGLLPRLTETCRRYNVPYEVVDRRAMISCPALRSRLQPSEAEQRTVRRLLLRDSGVVVAESESSRCALAVELTARRQQRTLVAVRDGQAATWWVQQLRKGLGLPPLQVCRLTEATSEAWIVVGQYGTLLDLPAPIQRNDYGLMICDGLESVDPLSFMRTVRSAGARYLLGLAARPTRGDGLHDTLFLALGGVTDRLSAEPVAGAIRLSCNYTSTDFAFPGYQGRAQYQALLAALAADEARTKAVAAEVAQEAQAGHSCLVLSERRDHLERLAAELPAALPAETITSTVRPADRARIITRFERGEIAVLLATSQIATESITTPKASRLFLTFPFSYARKLNKLVARLMEPAEGKKQGAAVFDYDDAKVETLHRAFERRRAFLDKLCKDAERQVQRDSQLKLPLG